MAKRIDKETKARADKAAQLYQDAFIEQFNRYFQAEIPPRDIGAFSADGTLKQQGQSPFTDMLKAYTALSADQRNLFHAQRAAKDGNVPATTVKGRAEHSAKWDEFKGLPEEDKSAFLEVYGKQPVPINATRVLVEDLPRGMQQFIAHDIRAIEHTGRLLNAAQQKLDGRIDDDIYADTVEHHAERLRHCDSLKQDILSQRFKEQLLTRVLEQLPEMMLTRDPELSTAKLYVEKDNIVSK